MSILGDAISMGGSNPVIVGFAWHTSSGTSYVVVGSTSSTLSNAETDGNFFTQSGGTFTCTRAGTYTIIYFGRGGYNSNGNAISLYFQLYANGTNVASSTGVANTGTHGSVNVTLEVGQTIYAQTRNSSGSNTHDFGYVIMPA